MSNVRRSTQIGVLAAVILVGILTAQSLTAGERTADVPCDGNAEQRIALAVDTRFDDSPTELAERVLDEQFVSKPDDEFRVSDIGVDLQLVEVIEADRPIAAFEISVDADGKTDIEVEWYCTDSEGELLGERFQSIRDIVP